ncbi:MAG: glycosyltransferase, partial [Candidatus Dormibacteraceae bacterium]
MSDRVLSARPSIRRSAGWVMTSAIAVGAVNFLYGLILTWLLPVRVYPAFAGTQALLVVCGTGASASVPWVLAHRVAQRSTRIARQDATSFAILLTLAQGVVAAALVMVITMGLARGSTVLPIAGATSTFLIFAAATSTGYLQGQQQFAKISFAHTVEVFLKLLAGITLVWLGVGAAGAIAGFGLGAVLVIAVGAPGLLRQGRLRLTALKDVGLWRQLGGLTAIQVGVAILVNLDIVTGSLMSRDGPALAGYQVSATLSRVPFFLAGAISMAVFARMAADPAGALNVIRSSTRIFARVAIPIAVTTATIPPPILQLFLPHTYPVFVESVLPFTAPAGALAATTNLLSTFFQAQRRYRRCALVLAIGLGVDLLAIVIGLLTHGVTGLAYGSLFGQTVVAVLFVITSARAWGSALRPGAWLLASALASLPLLYLRQLPWAWLVYALLVCGVTAWATFILAPRNRDQDRTARVLGVGDRLWKHVVARIAPERLGKAGQAPTSSRTAALQPPRIYLLTSHPVAPPWSGADKNLARALLAADLGAEFTFIGDRADGTVWPARHQRRALPFATGIPTTREQLRLFWWLYRDRAAVDILHALITFRPSLLKEVALLALPLVRRSRLVVTCPSGRHLPLRLLRRAAATVAISRWTEQALAGAGLANVRRIPPGIDLRWFWPGTTVEGTRRLGLDLAPTLLFAGHYDEGGGLDAAIEVLRRLRLRVPSLRLLTAMRTRPSRADRRRRTESEAHIRALGLEDVVVPLGDRADIRSAIWASAAVLFQPVTLGIKMDLPMVLLEALACGRPIVVSATESLGELADGSGAVTIGPADSTATLHHLERLLTGDDYARSCARSARALAERRYSVEEMVNAYEDLYHDLQEPGELPRRPRPVEHREYLPAVNEAHNGVNGPPAEAAGQEHPQARRQARRDSAETWAMGCIGAGLAWARTRARSAITSIQLLPGTIGEERRWTIGLVTGAAGGVAVGLRQLVLG